MSIINEALKKAEQEKEYLQNKPSLTCNQMPSRQINHRRFLLKKGLVWLSSILVCSWVIFLLNGLLKKNSAQQIPPPAALPQIAAHPLQPSAQAPKPSQPKEISTSPAGRTADFDLSGIIYDKQNPLVIINNRIIGEGAFINGAQVVKIYPNFVQLAVDGEKLTLKIK